MVKKIIIPLFLSLLAFSPALAQQNSIIPDKIELVKAKVISIISEEKEEIPGTNATGILQKLNVKILEGSQTGKELELDNDYVPVSTGDVFFLKHTIRGEDGREFYNFSEPYRLPTIYLFVALFVLAVLIFGGIQGLRGLSSLIGSFVLILFVMLPGILHGYSPVLITIGVSSLIIILGSYITHGFNRTTTSAVIGMIATVLFTGTLAYFAVHQARLSGYSSDESVYLNLNSGGTIDMVGLLFGGIMIGLLGVLYDVAIGQAISVEELHQVGPHLSRRLIYQRAIRIGREHIGALVNTLAIAYVGASLPLLLLFYSAQGADAISISATLNKEIFATEIIRIMIGSLGLVLAVPITTLLSVWLLMKKSPTTDPQILAEEKNKLEHLGHHH